MTTLAYGTWPSPLTAATMAAGVVGVSGAASVGDRVWWLELRPTEGGRLVLVSRERGPQGPVGEAIDMVAEPYSARNRVHEYGGGAWWPGTDSVYFTNWSDQRIYRIPTAVPDSDTGGPVEPQAITPEAPTTHGWRYADGREHPDGGWLACVRERHLEPTDDEPHPEPLNELVAVATDGDESEPRVLGLGVGETAQADFVASPRFSPDGRWLSWIRWNHPQMPWDGTQLCVAPVFGGMRLGNIQVIAGSAHESINGTSWTSNGQLVYSSDRSGWWNLHRWTPGSPGDETITHLVGSEIGAPQWNFGVQQWAELAEDRLVAIVTTDAVDSLVIVEQDGSLTGVETPFVSFASIATTNSGTILVVGASPQSLAEPVEIGPDGSIIGRYRPPSGMGIDPAWFSVARPITVEANGRTAHAFIYPPTAPGINAPEGELPPLVVMGHGGPTAHSNPALNVKAQYWSSRGFAVADVNYGGSTGFGRAYRQLLNDNWGIVDVEDCVAVAVEAAKQGLVDGDRLAIRGGSAGGFTVLKALIDSDVFSAGTNLFGVADLEALATDTHKFESRYLDGMIGPYPEARETYIKRSPIHHVDGLSCPLLVLQGLEDEIVPPNQSEAIVAAVAAKNIPHAYVAFEGEQHGFRQAKNIIRSFEVELWFYGKVFGFTPADEIEAPEGAVGL